MRWFACNCAQTPRILRRSVHLVIADARPALIAIFLFFPFPLLAATAEPPCAVAGCSGELCVNESDAGNIASICIWSPTADCYTYYGVCKKQENGKCGWEQNYDLQQCLKHKGDDSGKVLEPYREDEYLKNRRR